MKTPTIRKFIGVLICISIVLFLIFILVGLDNNNPISKNNGESTNGAIVKTKNKDSSSNTKEKVLGNSFETKQISNHESKNHTAYNNQNLSSPIYRQASSMSDPSLQNNGDSNNDQDNLEKEYNSLSQKSEEYSLNKIVVADEDINSHLNSELSSFCTTEICKEARLEEIVEGIKVERITSLIQDATHLREKYPERGEDLKAIEIKMLNLLTVHVHNVEAARQKQQEEIEKARQEAIGQSNTDQLINAESNTYPAAAECPQDNLNGYVYGGYKCQSISYVGWMAYNTYNIATDAWGNANTWDNTARALGYRVDGNPEIGSIAQTDAGYYGHVMWVEDVYADGTVLVSEYNGIKYADFSMRRIPAAGYNFIHLNK